MGSTRNISVEAAPRHPAGALNGPGGRLMRPAFDVDQRRLVRGYGH